MKEVTIYTDGACSGNPGRGGWGAILEYNGHELELSGYDPDTTNNRMELQAAIEGLARLKEPCRVHLYTDSAYLHNAFAQNWFKGWIAKGWMRNKTQPVLNRDLWEQLLAFANTHDITWHKVRGHADNVNNNRCDKLATDAIKNRHGIQSSTAK